MRSPPKEIVVTRWACCVQIHGLDEGRRDPPRALGMKLHWGPRGVRFLTREVPLYTGTFYNNG